MPSGRLNLSLKVSHWLRQNVVVDTSNGSAPCDFDLINGDANGDNHVGLSDLGVVLQAYGGIDAAADLDGSGGVGLADIATVLLNFGSVGDP